MSGDLIGKIEEWHTMRGELTQRADSWLVICADSSCSQAVYLDAGMSRRAASSSAVYRGWRKVDGLYRCPEHVRKVWVA